jgi:hypothetical protein
VRYLFKSNTQNLETKQFEQGLRDVVWENSTPTNSEFTKIQEEFKKAKKTVRNMSFCKPTNNFNYYSYGK